jgi:hypothetical protein
MASLFDFGCVLGSFAIVVNLKKPALRSYWYCLHSWYGLWQDWLLVLTRGHVRKAVENTSRPPEHKASHFGKLPFNGGELHRHSLLWHVPRC